MSAEEPNLPATRPASPRRSHKFEIPCGNECGALLKVEAPSNLREVVEAMVSKQHWMVIAGRSVTACICPTCIPEVDKRLAADADKLPADAANPGWQCAAGEWSIFKCSDLRTSARSVLARPLRLRLP